MTSQESTGNPRGRPHTPGLRDHLLKHTLRILLRDGYRKFSMGAVAASAGASKETLYRRFGDRSGLLTAALEKYSEGVEALLLANITPDLDTTKRLRQLALNYLHGCYLPEAVALQRIACSDGAAGLGPLFAEKFTDRAVAILTAELERMGTPNPAADAEVFLGMIEGKLRERVLLGARLRAFEKRRDAIVDHAVSIFAGYLRKPSGSSRR